MKSILDSKKDTKYYNHTDLEIKNQSLFSAYNIPYLIDRPPTMVPPTMLCKNKNIK